MLYEYLKLFVWHGKEQESGYIRDYNISLSEDYRRFAYGDEYDDHDSFIDIAPLLRTSLGSPGFQLKSAEPSPNLNLCSMMSKYSPTWAKYLTTAISSINYLGDIDVEVKPCHAEDWMAMQFERNSYEHSVYDN
jgi:hypothetical protein